MDQRTKNISEERQLQRRQQKRRQIQRKRRIRRIKMIAVFLLLLTGLGFGICHLIPGQASAVHIPPSEFASYPDWLQEMVKRNPETEDFAKDYENREDYIGKPIDLSGEYHSGEVPMLFQWDRRWGYDPYGEENIGMAGCGPTCLSMAYIYLTGDTSKNPREMAEFAEENGYYSEEGTAWSLWTEGAAKLGLHSTEVSLDETVMKNRLDDGQVIICSMAPGDFTTMGHFILIRGYGGDGFYVNDPNRRSNSEKSWDFERLRGQIKCLWALS